jgi:hypothetical protein
MISGVSFQPGQPGSQGTTKPRTAPGNTGVQEAIKVLSLRLPRVVGAQSIAPAPLLNSQGSGGNPRVDSVVNQVLSRMLPTEGSAPSPAAPMVPPSDPMSAGPSSMSPAAPTFNGIPSHTPLSTFMQPQEAAPSMGDVPRAPRITPGDDEIKPQVISPEAGQGNGIKEVLQPSATDQPGTDPMADFLEFLRRNQFVEPSPPQEPYAI